MANRYGSDLIVDVMKSLGIEYAFLYILLPAKGNPKTVPGK